MESADEGTSNGNLESISVDLLNALSKHRKELEDFAETINIYESSSTLLVESKIEESAHLCFQEIQNALRKELKPPPFKLQTEFCNSIQKINEDFKQKIQAAQEKYKSSLKSLTCELEKAALNRVAAIINGEKQVKWVATIYFEVIQSQMGTLEQRPKELVRKMLKDDTAEFLSTMTLLEEALMGYKREMTQHFQTTRCMSDQLFCDLHKQAEATAKAKFNSDSSRLSSEFANGIQQMHGMFAAMNELILSSEQNLVLQMTQKEPKIVNFYNDIMKTQKLKKRDFSQLQSTGNPVDNSDDAEPKKKHIKLDWTEFLRKENEKELAEQAKNFKNDLVQKYQADMMRDTDSMKDLDNLYDHHKLCLKKAQEEFYKKYKEDDDDFAKPFFIDLEKEILKAYMDYFKSKLVERANNSNKALADARKLYKEEMEKHYNNNVFMRPADLESLHNRLSGEAITKCQASAPLSAIQKNDLKSALELTYQQYKEQNDMNVPVDPAIGIDLGTTYSCVAVYLKGEVKVIPNGQGTNITPSCVRYNDAGYMESVGQPAKSKAFKNAENTIFDAKRIIGRDMNDSKLQRDMEFWPFKVVEDQKVPKIQINSGKLFYPEQVSSEVLKEMRKNAEAFLGCEVNKAVITVPAYFNDGQRQATIDAGKLAGLEVLTILNEPTSAAIAYKLQHSEDLLRHVLVYDLGGGTFDVSVLKMSKGKIEVLAVDGDTHLGGQDFDQKVMEYCLLEFQKKEDIDLMEGKDSSNATERHNARRRLQLLQQACEEAKKELSSCRKTDIYVPDIYKNDFRSFHLDMRLIRAKFEELNEELFTKMLEIVDRVLESAKLAKGEIEDVVLVGGSTKIPKVQEILREYFEGIAFSTMVNPNEALAYGAAVQAAIMNGQISQESIDFNKIEDVCPMSLGVKASGGGFSCFIPKNTKIPTKITQRGHTTFRKNQKTAKFHVYQGENPVAVDNIWLGEFCLKRISPADAGRELIDVTMEIDLHGILHISAVSQNTEDTNSIEVTVDKQRMRNSTIKTILLEAEAGVTKCAR